MKCTDKSSFKRRGDAWAFLQTYRYREGFGRMYIYECRYCHQFHLTHIRPERFKRRWAESKKYNFNELTER